MADREEMTSYVGIILDAWLATAGMSPTDTVGQLKEPLDAADLAMTFVTISEADPTGIEAAYQALAIYHTLRRVALKVDPRFDVTIAGDSYRLSQSGTKLEKALASAYADAIFLAGAAAVAGGTGADAITSGPGIGAIELDWSGGDPLADEYSEYTGWSPRW